MNIPLNHDCSVDVENQPERRRMRGLDLLDTPIANVAWKLQMNDHFIGCCDNNHLQAPTSNNNEMLFHNLLGILKIFLDTLTDTLRDTARILQYSVLNKCKKKPKI